MGEIGTYGPWVALDAAPVIDEADEDEDDDHDDLDHGEPVLRLSCFFVTNFISGQVEVGSRTVYTDMDELHNEDGCNDNEGPLPSCQARIPILCHTRIVNGDTKGCNQSNAPVK